MEYVNIMNQFALATRFENQVLSFIFLPRMFNLQNQYGFPDIW